MTDTEKIVVECIKTVLRNEGYNEEKIKTVLNWNYTDIKEIIEKR